MTDVLLTLIFIPAAIAAWVIALAAAVIVYIVIKEVLK